MENSVELKESAKKSVKKDANSKHEKKQPLRRVFRVLDRLKPITRNSFAAKVLDRLGCADEILRNKSEDSRILSFWRRRQRKSRIFGRMKIGFGSRVEQSRVLQLIFRILNYFYNLPIVCFGIMLFVAGLTVSCSTAVVGYMQGMKNLLSLDYLGHPMVIPGMIIFLISIPLLILDTRSLSAIVGESRLAKRIFFGFLGMDPSFLKKSANKKGHIGGLAFLLSMLIGVFSGLATHYFGAGTIPIALASLLAVVVVMTSPEAGLISLAAFLPLMGHKLLYGFLLLILLSFSVKVLRGKRSLHFTLIDWTFLFMAFIVILNCVVFAGDGMFAKLVVMFCLIAPVASHLLQSNGVVTRVQKGLLFSSFVTVLAVILRFVLGYLPRYTMRELPFDDFCGYVIRNFDSISGAGAYLLLILPLVLARSRLARSVREYARYILHSLLIFFGLFITGSRTIAIAGVLVLVIYLILRTPRHLLTVFLAAVVLLPVFFFLLPDRIVDLTVSRFESSAENIWAGFAEFGKQFVESAKNYFTGVGFEAAKGTNLYTVLLSAIGILGLFAFVMLMLLLLGYAFVSVTRARSACPRLMPVMVGCRASLCGLLLVATRMVVVNNPIVLLTFCLLCGYTVGIGRTMRRATVLAEAIKEEDIEFSPIYSKGGGQYE